MWRKEYYSKRSKSFKKELIQKEAGFLDEVKEESLIEQVTNFTKV